MRKDTSARDPNAIHMSKSTGLSKRDSRTWQEEALNFPLIPEGRCSRRCQQIISALGKSKCLHQEMLRDTMWQVLIVLLGWQLALTWTDPACRREKHSRKRGPEISSYLAVRRKQFRVHVYYHLPIFLVSMWVCLWAHVYTSPSLKILTERGVCGIPGYEFLKLTME